MTTDISRPAIGLALAFALALGAPCHVRAAERAPLGVSAQQIKALGVQLLALRRDAAPLHLSLPARVAVPASHEHIVSAPLAGLAVQLHVQLNQPVRQGAPLLRIASPELGALQLQLMQAGSRAGLARQTARRERALFEDGIVAARRVQEAEAALADAEATLRHARAALRLAGLSNAAIERVLASGQPEDGVTLSAAQSGTITQIEVKPGQRVEPSTVLMHLTQPGRLLLEIQAPAGDAAAWRLGSKLSVQGRTASATIVSVSPAVAADSQTVALRAELDSAGAALRPGELVTVQAPLRADDAGWDVPLSALSRHGKDAYVFVRSAAGFDARPVRLLHSAGQRARVGGALQAGDQIAVAGVVALKAAWRAEAGSH